eukprot:2344686-Rhodomonas_salina.1
MPLRACYAMPSTDLGMLASMVLCAARYRPITACYAVPGTDLSRAPVLCPSDMLLCSPGTDRAGHVSYAPMRPPVLTKRVTCSMTEDADIGALVEAGKELTEVAAGMLGPGGRCDLRDCVRAILAMRGVVIYWRCAVLFDTGDARSGDILAMRLLYWRSCYTLAMRGTEE